jgi:predicted metal-dependent phosphotriesterase family hydrolase
MKALENWYPTYIHKKLIPKMKEAGVTDEQINTMRRLLTGE